MRVLPTHRGNATGWKGESTAGLQTLHTVAAWTRMDPWNSQSGLGGDGIWKPDAEGRVLKHQGMRHSGGDKTVKRGPGMEPWKPPAIQEGTEERRLKSSSYRERRRIRNDVRRRGRWNQQAQCHVTFTKRKKPYTIF